LTSTLPLYLKQLPESLSGSLKPEDVQLRYVGCYVEDHAQARAIGLAAHADVVLWGKALCKSPRQGINVKLELPKGVSVNSGNTISSSPGARMTNQVRIQVNVPAPEVGLRELPEQPKFSEASFQSSLTVVDKLFPDKPEADDVAWPPLPENFASGPAPDVRGLGLPELAVDQSQLVLQFVLGLYSLRRGNYTAAAQLFQQTRDQANANGQALRDIQRMLGIGLGLAAAGKEERAAALAALEKALAMCPLSDAGCQAASLSTLGWWIDSRRWQGGTNEVTYYERALKFYQQLGDHLGEAETQASLGRLWPWPFWGVEEKFAHYERALDLYRQLGQRRAEAAVYTEIGSFCLNRGINGPRSTDASPLFSRAQDSAEQALYIRARDSFERALRLYQQLGDQTLYAKALVVLGLTYYKLGEKGKARELLEEALPWVRRRPVQQQSMLFVFAILGNIYVQEGRIPQARAYYEEALFVAVQKHEPVEAELRKKIDMLADRFARPEPGAKAADSGAAGLLTAAAGLRAAPLRILPPLSAELNYSREELEAFIQKWTSNGYQPVSDELSGDLSAFQPMAIRLKRGRCYRVVLRLKEGATLSDLARNGLEFRFWPANGGPAIHSGPGFHGPGGVGSVGCPQEDSEVLMILQVSGVALMSPGRTYVLGRGAFVAQIYARDISEKELAAQEASRQQQVLEQKQFQSQRIVDTCRRCRNEQLRCLDQSRTETAGNCTDNWRYCLILGGIRDQNQCP
jgi:tetratricopeptide (TPR) repeat protein